MIKNEKKKIQNHNKKKEKKNNNTGEKENKFSLYSKYILDTYKYFFKRITLNTRIIN